MQEERIGAAVTAGGDDDLRFAAARGGHRAHVLGCQVGHIGRQDQCIGCAACNNVTGSLRQGRVELKFGARGRWAATGIERLGGRGYFGQRMASQTSRRVERVIVAADDNDLRINMGQADGIQRAREEIAVERAAFLGREKAGQAALALGEGLDRNDCPQAHFSVRHRVNRT